MRRGTAANIAKLPGNRRSSLKQVCNPDCYDAAGRKWQNFGADNSTQHGNASHGRAPRGVRALVAF